METEQEFLLRLANTRMPFGKYSGRLLIDLPEAYVVWFSRKGWPEGDIGELLASLYTIKENGLEALLRPLVRGDPKRDLTDWNKYTTLG